ncbi:SKP1-like protein 4 isoform X3 [Varroa jacobsoni]|uniref:SKP1-like protein 4 isoform X3 n=1 Tax=Varroa jacobsoni TaxID=62625 RepID=UPI000BF6E833|nr:SKP1-like protein 4 isoform X3 [Varroa jacobsoni]
MYSVQESSRRETVFYDCGCVPRLTQGHRQSRMESRKFSLTSNERRLTAQTRFFVDEELAKLSPVLSRMICMPSDRPLQLKSVDATTLALIREWLEHHRSQKSRPDGKLPRDNWDYWFISEVAAGDLLHELIMAAHHLRINDLVELASEAFAKTLDASPEGLRMKFNVADDFTVAERQALTKELGYCLKRV